MTRITSLIIVLLLLGSTNLCAQDKQLINSEAKRYCKCNKSLDKLVRKMDKKAEQEQKGYKPYTPGMKLFGGETIEFNFKDCMDNKRSSQTKSLLAELHDKEKKKLNRKVRAAIKRVCPNADPSNY